MTSFKTLVKISLIALALSFPGTAAYALAPTAQVKETIEQLTAALQDYRASKGEGKTDIQARLRRLLLPRFDFTEMARRSLGKHWANHQNRQDEFVPLFVGFVEHAYIDTIQSFNSEKILYTREIVNNNLAEVHTRVISARGEEVAVNYRLHLADEDWKVYDVVIDNISLVNNFRSQFNRILTSASFDELLRKLQERRGNRKS